MFCGECSTGSDQMTVQPTMFSDEWNVSANQYARVKNRNVRMFCSARKQSAALSEVSGLFIHTSTIYKGA